MVKTAKPLLRIFCYMPTPRVWKSTITARFLDINIELRGTKPTEIKDWLWDFDARPLTKEDKVKLADKTTKGRTGFSIKLYKTASFLATQPYGTIPAAFSPDGKIGIFESNSIMRLVARLKTKNNTLYGSTPYESSRIDGFLDASLIFARSSQKYLLSINNNSVNKTIRNEAKEAYISYMTGIENALRENKKNGFITSKNITLADICFFCEFSLFYREIIPLNTPKNGINSIINELGPKFFNLSIKLSSVLFKRGTSITVMTLSTHESFSILVLETFSLINIFLLYLL